MITTYTKVNLTAIGLTLSAFFLGALFDQSCGLRPPLWLTCVLLGPFALIYIMTLPGGAPPRRFFRALVSVAVCLYLLGSLLVECVCCLPQLRLAVHGGQHVSVLWLQVVVATGLACCAVLVRACVIYYRLDWYGPPGTSRPRDERGCIYIPATGETYHYDLGDRGATGPHSDFVAADGTCSRILPDGSLVTKDERTV